MKIANVTPKNVPSFHIDETIRNVSIDERFRKVLISLDTTYLILSYAELQKIITAVLVKP